MSGTEDILDASARLELSQASRDSFILADSASLDHLARVVGLPYLLKKGYTGVASIEAVLKRDSLTKREIPLFPQRKYNGRIALVVSGRNSHNWTSQLLAKTLQKVFRSASLLYSTTPSTLRGAVIATDGIHRLNTRESSLLQPPTGEKRAVVEADLMATVKRCSEIEKEVIGHFDDEELKAKTTISVVSISSISTVPIPGFPVSILSRRKEHAMTEGEIDDSLVAFELSPPEFLTGMPSERAAEPVSSCFFRKREGSTKQTDHVDFAAALEVVRALRALKLDATERVFALSTTASRSVAEKIESLLPSENQMVDAAVKASVIVIDRSIDQHALLNCGETPLDRIVNIVAKSEEESTTQAVRRYVSLQQSSGEQLAVSPSEFLAHVNNFSTRQHPRKEEVTTEGGGSGSAENAEDEDWGSWTDGQPWPGEQTEEQIGTDAVSEETEKSSHDATMNVNAPEGSDDTVSLSQAFELGEESYIEALAATAVKAAQAQIDEAWRWKSFTSSDYVNLVHSIKTIITEGASARTVIEYICEKAEGEVPLPLFLSLILNAAILLGESRLRGGRETEITEDLRRKLISALESNALQTLEMGNNVTLVDLGLDEQVSKTENKSGQLPFVAKQRIRGLVEELLARSEEASEWPVRLQDIPKSSSLFTDLVASLEMERRGGPLTPQLEAVGKPSTLSAATPPIRLCAIFALCYPLILLVIGGGVFGVFSSALKSIRGRERIAADGRLVVVVLGGVRPSELDDARSCLSTLAPSVGADLGQSSISKAPPVLLTFAVHSLESALKAVLQ